MDHKDDRMENLTEAPQFLGEASLSTVAFKCRALRRTHELWYFMNHSSIHVPFNFPLQTDTFDQLDLQAANGFHA